jgi:hypothetical protein
VQICFILREPEFREQGIPNRHAEGSEL